VRPPHGRAPALISPVVRRLRSVFLLPLLGLALVAAGCGGDGAAVQEVPGPPATLTVPHQKGAADVSASATPTPSATPTATPTPAAGSTGSTGTTGGTGTNTGAAATPTPAAQNNSASKQAPDADGSPPQQFEQFCEENAGAC
jgi:peptidylprolyl isomerase